MAEELNCMPGCDTTPRDPAAEMAPGQLLHRLHSLGAAEQLALVGRMLESQESAQRCFVHNHEARLGECDKRVAYLEARVGELHNTIGELRAESENRLEVGDRLGWLLVEAREQLAKGEASCQAWAEEAERLTKVRRMVHLLLGYDPDITADSEALRGLEKLALAWQRGHTAPWAEVEWLRREVEFEANAADPGREGGYSRDNIRFPLCSCFTAEQLAALDLTRWARPQCAVHPDGEPA